MHDYYIKKNKKMVISGVEILGLIKEAIDEKIQVQPAGFDLTLKEILCFRGSGKICFNEKNLPETEPVKEKKLKCGCYKIIYNEIVHIPKDCIALGFPRSTLLRMGCDIRTAVWDPGYVGRSESLLLVHNPEGVEIEKNARVLQLVFIKISNPKKEYTGSYKFENL